MEYAGVVISILSAVVAVAVAWGVITTKLEEMRKATEAKDAENLRWRADMEKRIEGLPTKTLCDIKHGFIDQTMHRIEGSIEELKDLIKELSKEISKK